jgi:hypothetical protein
MDFSTVHDGCSISVMVVVLYLFFCLPALLIPMAPVSLISVCVCCYIY